MIHKIQQILLITITTVTVLLTACGNTDISEQDKSEAVKEEILMETPALQENTDAIETPAEAEEEEQTVEDEKVVGKTFQEREYLETPEEEAAAKKKSNGEIEVEVVRTSKPITNEAGQVLAEVYYERPVVSGNSEAAQKINQFFEEEERDWFAGQGRLTGGLPNYYANFVEALEDMVEGWGEQSVVDDALSYIIDTRIVLFNENLLSVFQIRNYKTGHCNWKYFGSTFDLNTGELLPLDALADIDADELGEFIWEAKSESKEIYEELGENNYLVTIGDETIDMRYEYFFDGKDFYIIMNNIEHSSDGLIAKWNSSWEKNQAIERISYSLHWENRRLRIHEYIY